MDDERQLPAVLDSVRRSKVVTLIGEEGLGKSRLTVEAAVRLADRLADGAWGVALDELAPKARLATRLTQTLGLPAPRGADPYAHLAKQLSGFECLLVVDAADQRPDDVRRLIRTTTETCRTFGS